MFVMTQLFTAPEEPGRRNQKKRDGPANSRDAYRPEAMIQTRMRNNM